MTPVHKIVLMNDVDLFEAVLAKNHHFNPNEVIPGYINGYICPDEGHCKLCRSMVGHTLHCGVLCGHNSRFARMFFEYAERDANGVNGVNGDILNSHILTMYFQLFVKLGDIDMLEYMISKYTINPSEFIFLDYPKFSLYSGKIAIFLLKNNLLSEECMNRHVDSPFDTDDVDVTRICIALGARTNLLKMDDMLMCENVCDLFILLDAAFGVDVDDAHIIIYRIDGMKRALRHIIGNDDLSQQTVVYAHHRFEIFDAIKEMLHSSLKWKNGELPSLFDMTSFSRKKRIALEDIEKLKIRISEARITGRWDLVLK